MEKVELLKVKNAVVFYTVLVKYRGHELVVSWDDYNGYDYYPPEGWTTADYRAFHDALDAGLDISADIKVVTHA